MREWANSDMRLTPVFIGLTALWLWSAPLTAQQEREPFVTPLTLDQMRDKQAVVETTEGTFVIDLLPEVAPNHVGLFMRMIEDGVYDGTIFHSMVARGIVQGGDPLTKDPARADVYGRGGLGLIDAEPNDEQHIAGTVSAVVVPGDPDSGGTQFLICVVAQPALDGHHTIWGRVSEGLPVVTRISLTPTDAEGNAQGRVEILSVSIRAAVPPPPVPFTTETVEELSSYRAVLDTDAGPGDDRGLRGPRSRACPELSAAGRRGRLRRHCVSSRRARIRHPDRLDSEPAHAVDRGAAERRGYGGTGAQRHTARRGHRVDGAR